jgi:hypothetical protein
MGETGDGWLSRVWKALYEHEGTSDGDKRLEMALKDAGVRDDEIHLCEVWPKINSLSEISAHPGQGWFKRTLCQPAGNVNQAPDYAFGVSGRFRIVREPT